MSFPTSTTQSLKSRALQALAADAPDGAVRSLFARQGDFLLLTDTPDDAAKGTEFFVEFPKDADPEPPRSLDLGAALYARAQTLFDGTWSAEVSVDGEPLRPTGPWETFCEDFDRSYAYLERSLPLSGGRRFSRRLFFAYNEALVLVFDELDAADAELDVPREWRYRSVLPLAPEARPRVDAETREIAFVRKASAQNKNPLGAKKGKSGKSALSEEDRLLAELAAAPGPDVDEDFARVFPLVLSEWRADAESGDLVVRDRTLELTSARVGSSLTAALLFDLNPRRAAKPCTWRKLTVGEDMEPVDEDSAVGRKIKIGQEQYVLYASTSPYPAIRSILSRNLLSDFMFGKFTVSRAVTPIVDVEIEEEE